jgi:hypothetical protein
MHFIENYRTNWKARVFQMSIPSSPLQTIWTFGRAMGRAVCHQPLTAEAWVRARFSPCGICGGQSGTGTGFSSNSSVSPCQYYSTVAFHIHILCRVEQRARWSHAIDMNNNHMEKKIFE